MLPQNTSTPSSVSSSKKKSARQLSQHDSSQSSLESGSQASMPKKTKPQKHKLIADSLYIDSTMADTMIASPQKHSRLSVLHESTTGSPNMSVMHKGEKKGVRGKSDANWEKAVEKARGLPDGCVEEESESSDNDTEIDVDDPPVKQEKAKASGKSKKLDVLQLAAKKIRKIGKKGDDGTKGTKRSHKDEDASPEVSPKKKKEEKKKEEGMSKKDLKIQRKMYKNNYELAKRSKDIWNELRRADLTPERREELSTELLSLIKGKAKDLITAHDTSRVIQCLMKYGTQEAKNALFEELRDEIVDMTKSKYAKFFVRKLLKYGTKAQRNYVFRKLNGHIRKLIRHKEAAEIVECAYNDYANAAQRASLIEEFYGPSFSVFKTSEMRTLEQLMTSQPEKRDSILSNMKETLSALVDKTVLQYSIIHRVFLEFFTFATPKLRSEMIETLREGAIHMLHTRDGARVAMHCLWYGTPKDRKVLVKSFKTYISKISKEEYGHQVMLALFDCVDDTKLVQKAILDEFLKSLDDLALHQYGRKVVLYLLAPRDPVHFCPDVVKVLMQGDNNPHSKKESAVRQQELLSYVSQALLNYIVKHCKELVMNNAAQLLILSIITHVKCDASVAMKSIAEIAAEPFVAGSLDSFHIVEHSAGHLTLKKLILKDAQRLKEGEKAVFTKILLDTLPAGSLRSWAACNRGCFILVTLLELNNADVQASVTSELKDVKPALKKMEFKGAQTLLQKLKNI